MNTFLRRMRRLAVAQTVLTVLRVLAWLRLALAVVQAGEQYRKRKGI